MPYLFLIFSLFFVSCRKDNQLKSPPVTIAASEQRSYLSTPQEVNGSYLRSKLLNQIVEERFPSGKSEHVVKNYDELHDVPMSKKEMELYMEKERLMAKLIVSYSDRTDIYFLPRGVKIQDVPAQLGLSPEAGRVFKWINATPRTTEGFTTYLVHVNHEDLMENDKKYFQEVFDYNDLSNKNGFVLVDGREAEITLRYNFYKEQAASQVYSGKVKSCNRDMMEAGECTLCSYKMLVASGKYQADTSLGLDDTGFRLMINGERFLTSELPTELKSNGILSFKIKAEGFLKGRQAMIEVEKTSPPVYQSTSSPFDYTGNCAKVEGSNKMVLQSRAEIDLNVKISGRGDTLRAISL